MGLLGAEFWYIGLPCHDGGSCSPSFFLYHDVIFIKKAFSTQYAQLADFHLNKLGWPIAMQMGMETASFSLSAIMVGWIGTTALAAHPGDARHFPNLLYDAYGGMGSRCRAG